MNQTKNSLQDSKQEKFLKREDYHFPIPGNLSQRSTEKIYKLLVPNVKTSSFIVDWQLQDTYQQNMDKSHT